MEQAHGDPERAPAAAGISGAETVYRRLFDGGPSMVAIDQVTGARRPTSGAFKPDDDGISVYRHALLEAAGLTPGDVRTSPWNLVVGVGVGDLRTIDLSVNDDPWPADVPDPQHPRNAAHALIVGMEGMSRGARRRCQKALVALPSVQILE